MHRWRENTKQQVLTVILLGLLTSLFLTRALLSGFTILFILSGTLCYWPCRNTIRFQSKNRALLFIFLFLVPFITGAYSLHVSEWWGRTQIKLPFLFFPFIFLFLRLEPVRVFIIHNLFILLVTGGTVYSMGVYYLNPNAVVEGYNQAKIIPTLLDNDHIRFSICVVIAGILLIAQHRHLKSPFLQTVNILIGCWLFVFLHILMCKTGLLMAYMAAGIFGVLQLLKKRKAMGIALICLLAVMPWVSYQTIPTFKKRVDYMLYDFSVYSTGNYREGLSDGARWISLKAGFGLVQKHPLTGVGYGDVAAAANRFYETHYALREYEKILPSSQYLIFAIACGIPGLLFLIWVLFRLLWQPPTSKNTFFLMFYMPLLASLAFEIHLESQYGVFIFCFFTLWFGKFVNPENLS